MLSSTKILISSILFFVILSFFSLISGKYFLYSMFLNIGVTGYILSAYFRDKKDETEILNVIATLSKDNTILSTQEIEDEMSIRVYSKRNGYHYGGDVKNVYDVYKKKGVIPFDIEVLYPNEYALRIKNK